MTPLEAAYQSIGNRANITFGQFQESVKSWEVFPVFVKDNVAGAILLNGEEVHACILAKYKCKWLNKSLYKQVFVNRLKQYGKLKTSVLITCNEGAEFVARCGFVKVGEAEGVAHYERCLDGH